MSRRGLWVVLALGTLAAGLAHAQTQPVPMPPGMSLPSQNQAGKTATPSGPAPVINGWEARQTADLQALDKVDDKTVTLSVGVNQTGQFGHLAIVVRACVVRPADQPADAAAYLDIVDPRPSAPAFHGWMLENEPAASMMQHPVYDVRVLGCH